MTEERQQKDIQALEAIRTMADLIKERAVLSEENEQLKSKLRLTSALLNSASAAFKKADALRSHIFEFRYVDATKSWQCVAPTDNSGEYVLKSELLEVINRKMSEQ